MKPLTRTQNEETVTQDGAQHRGLHDAQLASNEGEDGDDELDRMKKARATSAPTLNAKTTSGVDYEPRRHFRKWH